MAKAKHVAKRSFDDGSKKGENGKAVDYKKGDEYKGSADEQKDALKKGLICSDKEFSAIDEVIDEKNGSIAELQKMLAERDKALGVAEDKVIELTASLEELQKEMDSLEIVEE